MARWYGSFMLRCWRLSGGEQRIEIEHMQSGERTRVTSLPAAIEWVEARCGQPAGAPAKEKGLRAMSTEENKPG